MLTKKQFDVLDAICENDGKCSQRKLSALTDFSVGTVNKLCHDLEELGYVDNYRLTDKGLQALEPYKVKRAVIIAAGFGSRLVPITLNTPKPLVRVNGKRIIETSLDALKDVGIEEIYIVRGYLGEQFDQLLYKYPNVKFIENNKYNEANNISSIFLSRHLLENSYVLEADMFVFNPKIIRKYQYSTNYLGVKVDKTVDWCFLTKNGVITKMDIGGEDCYRMYGFSYWTEEDGKKLFKDVEKVYTSPGGKERYWDEVPLKYCKNNYTIYIRECQEKDIIEIDTFNELKALDKSYEIK